MEATNAAMTAAWCASPLSNPAATGRRLPGGGLGAVEAAAQRQGVSWVMLNTDEPSSVPVFTKYGVSELCARRRERAPQASARRRRRWE